MKLSELLTDDSKWTQGEAARDSAGESAPAFAESAVCWCLLGAIDKCYPPYERPEIEVKLIERIYGRGKRSLGKCLSVWNDAKGRKFAEVRKVILECDL